MKLLVTRLGLLALSFPFQIAAQQEPSPERLRDPVTGRHILRYVSLLVPDGNGFSLRHIAVARDASEWSVAERWESTRLKPYFNDFFGYESHSFGFDGNILATSRLCCHGPEWGFNRTQVARVQHRPRTPPRMTYAKRLPSSASPGRMESRPAECRQAKNTTATLAERRSCGCGPA